MPTHSPDPIPSSASTPVALGTVAPSARAVYLQQKRGYAACRGAEIVGGGVAVPLITHADTLALVACWSSNVPALASRRVEDAADPEVVAWARCALAARALATGRAGDAPYPDRVRLWEGIKRIALAMDTRNVSAPSWSAVADGARHLGELAKTASATAADADDGADHIARSIGGVADALASGASKVSAAAGRGAGEGVVTGALAAAAVPMAIVGGVLVGGFALWASSRNDNNAREPSRAASSRSPRSKRAGGRR